MTMGNPKLTPGNDAGVPATSAGGTKLSIDLGPDSQSVLSGLGTSTGAQPTGTAAVAANTDSEPPKANPVSATESE